MRFPEFDAAFALLTEPRGAQYDEHGIVVDFQFGTLMRSMSVFDRQLVETKRLLNMRQERLRRFVEPDPEKTIGVAPGVP